MWCSVTLLITNPAGRGRNLSYIGRLAAVVALSLASVPPVRAQNAPAGKPPAAHGVPVQAVAAKRQDVPVTLRDIGSVQAFASVLVRARVDGTLNKVFFTEGQEVKAGAPLAQIDPRPYAAAFAQAQAKRAADAAQLSNSQRDLQRYSSLARSDFASRQQVDTQQASVTQAQANIQGDEAAMATAQLNLDFASIASPIEGRTGLRLVDPGNLIHASDATGIVTVTQIHPIAVIFTLPQETLPQVQAAMAARKLPVIAFAQDDRTQLAEGTLLTIDNQIDQSTGTIRLKAIFPNTDDKLWPGQFINARLQVATLAHALTVPSNAIQRGPNGLYVYVVGADAAVKMQPVAVQQDDGKIAVIGDGLPDAAVVVTAGQSRLQDGAKVSVGDPAGNAAKPS